MKKNKEVTLKQLSEIMMAATDVEDSLFVKDDFVLSSLAKQLRILAEIMSEHIENDE